MFMSADATNERNLLTGTEFDVELRPPAKSLLPPHLGRDHQKQKRSRGSNDPSKRLESDIVLADSDERYLTDKQVAARYGVSRPTIWRWKATNPAFPAPVEVSSGTTRWRLSSLRLFEAGFGNKSRSMR